MIICACYLTFYVHFNVYNTIQHSEPQVVDLTQIKQMIVSEAIKERLSTSHIEE